MRTGRVILETHVAGQSSALARRSGGGAMVGGVVCPGRVVGGQASRSGLGRRGVRIRVGGGIPGASTTGSPRGGLPGGGREVGGGGGKRVQRIRHRADDDGRFEGRPARRVGGGGGRRGRGRRGNVIRGGFALQDEIDEEAPRSALGLSTTTNGSRFERRKKIRRDGGVNGSSGAAIPLNPIRRPHPGGRVLA